MNATPNPSRHSPSPPGYPLGAERDGVRGLLLALCLLLCPVQAVEAAQHIHGENSVFAGQGVALAWGVLKGATEEQTQVIIRIVPAGGTFAYVSVEGIDPFTEKRQDILTGQPLAQRVDVRSPRSTFADFPRREIHFYTANDWHAGRPALTVYFMGVPDTSPEFTSETALFTYLTDALAKATGGRQGRSQ